MAVAVVMAAKVASLGGRLTAQRVGWPGLARLTGWPMADTAALRPRSALTNPALTNPIWPGNMAALSLSCQRCQRIKVWHRIATTKNRRSLWTSASSNAIQK